MSAPFGWIATVDSILEYTSNKNLPLNFDINSYTISNYDIQNLPIYTFKPLINFI